MGRVGAGLGGGGELKEERERKKDFVHSYGHWPVLCFILFIGMMFHDVCSLNLYFFNHDLAAVQEEFSI